MPLILTQKQNPPSSINRKENRFNALYSDSFLILIKLKNKVIKLKNEKLLGKNARAN